LKTPGQVKFIKALKMLEAEGILDESILISAASLRVLGVRIYTYFVDLLAPNSYYQRKAKELNFSPKYELEPMPFKVSDFSLRVGTIKGGLCSFRHLVEPFNVYEEAEFVLDNRTRLIKIRPQDYVRKDSEEAIERLIQGTDEKYWKELYSYHKQIEAIDLGISRENMKLGAQKFLKLED
jgi:hypothetical protein